MYDIRKIRKSLGLTIEQFAKRCNSGISTVVNWEQGRSFPRGDKLATIHQLFLEAQARECELELTPLQAQDYSPSVGHFVDNFLALDRKSQLIIENLIDHLLHLENLQQSDQK